VAARDACSVQLVQGKFLKRVDADLVLEAGNQEGAGVNWVGGESDEKTYLAGGGRDWQVNEDGSISLVRDPDLVLGVDSGVESDQHKNIRFPDFEGVVDDFGAPLQMAVYRVTLPRGGFREWAGRPPPLAPEDLYTGPRSDGLLSTDEISGEYCCCCFPFFCDWMTVVPRGPDAIETWSKGCRFIPCVLYQPVAEGAVRTRDPGTNAFNPQNPDPNSNLMTFSADGTASGCYKKRQTSQKRTFQKVDAGDLAGTWCGCFCIPNTFFPLSPIFCTKKRALNQDQYEESGCCCVLGLPLLGLPPCPYRILRTRNYVNGHPTNVFTLNDLHFDPTEDRWYRDSGCAYGTPTALPGGPALPTCATKC